jgi:hypothetical protein
MQITIGEIKAAVENEMHPATGAVLRVAPLNKLKAASLPMGILFDLADLHEALQAKLKTAEAQRLELLNQHGTPSKEQPGQFEVAPEFWTAYAELLNHSIEIDAPTISRDELLKHSAKLEKVDFNTDDVTALKWLIVKAPEAQAAPVTSIAEHQAAKEATA